MYRAARQSLSVGPSPANVAQTYLIWDRFGRQPPDARPWGKAGTRRVVTVVQVLVAVAAVVIAAQVDPPLAKAISPGADNILRR